MIRSPVVWLLAALFGFTGNPAASAEEKEWVVLEGARILPHPSNDGDSFRVRHQGKEYVFRLCYVDTPETEDFDWMKDRIRDQAEYWKIPESELYNVADRATQLAMRAMRTPFTIYTQWHDARGMTPDGRFFAIVKTRDGDLAELLVRNGLARIYGFMPQHPDGRSGPKVMNDLRTIEKQAFRRKEGAWANSRRTSPPKRAPVTQRDSGSPTRRGSAPRPTPTPERIILPGY